MYNDRKITDYHKDQLFEAVTDDLQFPSDHDEPVHPTG